MSGQRPGDLDGCGESSAAYVLGALTQEEHESFLAHLHSCAICREEVAALQVVADALPALSPPSSAPPELRQRVMASVRADLAESGAPAARPAGELRWAWLRGIGLRPAFGLAAAAAAILVAAVLLLTGGGGASPRVIQAKVLVPRAQASLRLSGTHAELDVAGLPQTAPGRVYEVWVKRSGAPQPTDALFTVTASGDATVGVPGSIAGVRTVMVTSEPVGGSRVPTRAPVIVANIA